MLRELKEQDSQLLIRAEQDAPLSLFFTLQSRHLCEFSLLSYSLACVLVDREGRADRIKRTDDINE